MRQDFLIGCLLIFPAWCAGYELSDIDVENLVELANYYWKGEIISIETEQPTIHGGESNDAPVAIVKVLMHDQRIYQVWATYLDGDWRIDDQEHKRLVRAKKRFEWLRQLKEDQD